MKKKKGLIFTIIALVVAMIAGISIYAAVKSSASARGEITASSLEFTAVATYSTEDNNFNWEYTKAGQKKVITISTNNQTATVLHRYYTIAATASDLNSAILVYYNDVYMGTLADISNKTMKVQDDLTFVPTGETKSDTITFELHQAAKSTIFNGKTASITLSTYTENANYQNYMFVSSKDEFKLALDDATSGLLSDSTIVLCKSINLESLAYEIKKPVEINLNGFTLSGGALQLNDAAALLKIVGSGSFTCPVTCTSYNKEAAVQMLKEHALASLDGGVEVGTTVNLFTNYAFYSPTVTASIGTYSSGVLTAPTADDNKYSRIGNLMIKIDSYTSYMDYKVFGSETALIEATLKHIPNSLSKDITTDLFLPTSIPDERSSITWKSSNKSIMDNTGKIVINYANGVEVTLTAEIKVNKTVYTRNFTFKVSVHNDEINFYKLVSEISPVILSTINNGANDDETLYYLPVVNQNSDGTLGSYDYRTNYKTPSTTKLYDWNAYNDIGLVEIQYSIDPSKVEEFDYISLTNNALCLNKNTINSYASLIIKGKFKDQNVYTSTINISIAVGSNTQLLENAFASVSSEVAQVDVLANMLSTRLTNGVNLESGNFTLPGAYVDPKDARNTYTISYSIPTASANVITRITKNNTTNRYEVVLNPEYYSSSRMTIAVTATVTYGSSSASRNFYFVVPEVLHIENLGNISTFNSIQYQVFQSLPEKERTNTQSSASYSTGFSVNGGLLTNSNYNYILLRDILGDAKYMEQQAVSSEYLTRISYSLSDYAQGVTELYFYTDSTNNTSTTDTAANDFIRLIQWAQSEGDKVKASTVVSNVTAINAVKDNYSNGKAFITDDELAVLKACYQYYTGANDTAWNTIKSQTLRTETGYIFDNQKLLNATFEGLSGIQFYQSTTADSFATIYGKYIEIVYRHSTATSANDKNVAPCQNIYNNKFGWYVSSEDINAKSNKTITVYKDNANTDMDVNYSFRDHNGNYWNAYNYSNSNDGDGVVSGVYGMRSYWSDKTMYITPNELMILKVFWLNATTGSDHSGNTQATSTTCREKINAVLGEYPGYTINDFDTVARAITSAFDACLTIPTYFTSDGVTKIINSFYANKTSGYALNGKTGNAKSFVSSTGNTNVSSEMAVGNTTSGVIVPYVTNLDILEGSLVYFSKLEKVYVRGNQNNYAFQSENGLSSFVSRTAKNNSLIKTLELEYCATSSNTFDVTSISLYNNLERINISHNPGIVSINELINSNRSKYKYVDISNIGVDFEYAEFAIDNIASATCTVKYSPETGSPVTTNISNPSFISQLSDFDSFVAKNIYLTNVVTDGSNSNTVYWRIESGAPLNSSEITAGKYPEISTAAEMNSLISPYYYCNSSFTYSYVWNDEVKTMNFVEGHVYKINYASSNLSFIDKGAYAVASSLSDSLADQTTQPTLAMTYTAPYTETSTENVVNAGTESTTNTESTTVQVQTTGGVVIKVNTVALTTSNNDYAVFWANSDYTEVTAKLKSYTESSTSNSGRYFAILTADEVSKIQNQSYTSNTTIGQGTTQTTGDFYLVHIANNTLYFVGVGNTAIDTDGRNIILSTTPTNTVTILKSNSKYYVRMTNNSRNYYLWFGTSNSNTEAFGYWDYRDNKGNYPYGSDLGNNKITKSTTNIYPQYVQFTYNDNTTTKINYAYSWGYDVIKVSGYESQITYRRTSTSDSKNGAVRYYYYTGASTGSIKTGSIIAVTSKMTLDSTYIEKVDTVSGDYYYLKFWYKTSSSAEKTYVDETKTVTSVSYTTTTNVTTKTAASMTPQDERTTTSGTWETWNLHWTYDTYTAQTYTSYVTAISNTVSAKSTMDKQVNLYEMVSGSKIILYRFTGSGTQSDTVYSESTTGSSKSYTNNYGYKLSISNNTLAWSQYSTSLSQTTTSTTMDSILATANTHFDDTEYGKYYGMLYGYSGTTMYLACGLYAEQYTVYQIMPNKYNTAFEWVKYRSYTKKTSDQILTSIGTNQCEVGDIFYSTATCAFGFFNGNEWYRLVIDGNTGTYNLVKYDDMSITIGSNYVTLTNQKITTKSNDYLGYAGIYEVVISAVQRTRNEDGSYTDQVKKYKIRLVGSRSS